MKHTLINIATLPVIISFVFIISVYTGCSSTPDKEKSSLKTSELEKYPEPEVRLSPGDIIEIRFFYTPALNIIQTIRPDGMITLQLVGEILAHGKTPMELKEDLYTKYKDFMSQLDIVVIVQSLSNRRVYVGGQVNSPGTIPMPGKLTVLEAILLAGGINMGNAKYNNILIIRYQNGKWIGANINLDDALKGVQSEPLYLQPQDIVYVPETRITKVNRWLDQHIGTILPEVGFTYTINPDTGNSFGIGSSYSLGN